MAARTKHVKLGSMVMVLPWHNPVRLAEEVSVLPKKRRHQLLARGAGEQSRMPWHADADC
jgi:hypothetical protein